MSLNGTLGPNGWVMDEIQSPVSGGGFLGTPNSLIEFGDSLTANGWATTGAPVNFTSLYMESPINWADAILGGAFERRGSYAVGGKTAAQILSEQLPSVLTSGAKYAAFTAGTNSLYTEALSAAAIRDQIVSIVEQLLSAGITPIWSTVWARGYNATATPEHLKLNDLLKRYAYLNRAGLFYDGYEITHEPGDSQGKGRAPLGTYYYDSTTHPNNLHAYYIGQWIASKISSRIYVPQRATTGLEDSTFTGGTSNLLANTGFTGTAGTVSANCTGTMPDNWTIDWATRTGTGSAAAAIIDITDPVTGLAIEKAIQVTISGTPAANDVLRISQSSGINTQLTAGDVVQAEGMVGMTTSAAVSSLAMRAQTNTNESTWWGLNGQTARALPATVVPMLARTREMTVLGSGVPGQARYDLRMTCNGNASGTVLTFYRPRFRKVS